MSKPGTLYDQADSFGWISIVLHWTTAIAIIALWFIGQSMSGLPLEEVGARRSLHVIIGLSFWILIAGRIFWRLRTKHPHARGQTSRVHQLAKITHYLMLTALTVMLISGPLTVWADPTHAEIAYAAKMFHSRAAFVLLLLVVLHILGTFKHLMFHDDETVARMFLPRKKSQ